MVEVEEMAGGGGQPLQIADMELGIGGTKGRGKDKKRTGKLKSKNSCIVL